jgi:hypothetical protein
VSGQTLFGEKIYIVRLREEARKIYSISIPDMEALWDGMGILTQKLTIWPDPLHLLGEGSKLFHIKIITEASASMGKSYPRAVRIRPRSDDHQKLMEGEVDGVIKREFSSQGHHVLTAHTSCLHQKLSSALRDERSAYYPPSGTSKFPKPAWYIQPYIAGLLYLGEVRAFIANGTLFNCVGTTPRKLSDPADLKIQETILLTPLSKLRYAGPDLLAQLMLTKTLC